MRPNVSLGRLVVLASSSYSDKPLMGVVMADPLDVQSAHL